MCTGRDVPVGHFTHAPHVTRDTDVTRAAGRPKCLRLKCNGCGGLSKLTTCDLHFGRGRTLAVGTCVGK